MNIKVKTTLVLLFTLVIGILLGVFLDRTIMRFRFQKRFTEVRQPRGITRMFENLIRPDESQYQPVKAILEKYSQKLHEQREKSFREMNAVMDSMRTELDQILTEEQKARFRNEMERMKQRRERPPRPGEMPPPPMPFDRPPDRPPARDDRQQPTPLLE